MVELEAELQEARRWSQHYHHALTSIRDLIGQLGIEGLEGEMGGAVMTSDLMKQIKHWLEHIKSIEGTCTCMCMLLIPSNANFTITCFIRQTGGRGRP